MQNEDINTATQATDQTETPGEQATSSDQNEQAQAGETVAPGESEWVASEMNDEEFAAGLNIVARNPGKLLAFAMTQGGLCTCMTCQTLFSVFAATVFTQHNTDKLTGWRFSGLPRDSREFYSNIVRFAFKTMGIRDEDGHKTEAALQHLSYLVQADGVNVLGIQEGEDRRRYQELTQLILRGGTPEETQAWSDEQEESARRMHSALEAEANRNRLFNVARVSADGNELVSDGLPLNLQTLESVFSAFRATAENGVRAGHSDTGKPQEGEYIPLQLPDNYQYDGIMAYTNDGIFGIKIVGAVYDVFIAANDERAVPRFIGKTTLPARPNVGDTIVLPVDVRDDGIPPFRHVSIIGIDLYSGEIPNAVKGGVMAAGSIAVCATWKLQQSDVHSSTIEEPREYTGEVDPTYGFPVGDTLKLEVR